MNKITPVIIYCIIALIVFVEPSIASDVIKLPASKGEIFFPHKLHVYILKDCKYCHEKGPGKILGLGKDWAHKTCRGCHTNRGKGPTDCRGCHKGDK